MPSSTASPNIGGDLIRNKPQDGAQLDFLNPLTRRMDLCLLFNEGANGNGLVTSVVDSSVFRQKSTTAFPPSWVNSPYGPCLDFSGGCELQFVRKGATNHFATTDVPWSVFVVFNSKLGLNECFVSIGESSDTNDAVTFGIAASNGLSSGGDPDNANAFSTAVPVTAGVWQYGGMSQINASTRSFIQNHNIYLNTGSVGAASAIGANQPIIIGASYINAVLNSATARYTGKIAAVYLWSRALPDAELREIDRDPWQIFVPEPSRRYWNLFVAAPVIGVAYDAVSNSGYQAAQSTYSWSHICSGSNRFLSVDVSVLSVPGTSVTGITYNGVALEFLGAQSTVSGAGRVECWGLKNPASGSNTITVTLSASVASSGEAVSYDNVNQSLPTEAFNSAQATNIGPMQATVTITPTSDNTWVHAAIATDDTAVTANQTSRNNVTGALGSGADEDTGPITPAAGTGMSYATAALKTWAIAGYAIRPVGDANTIFQSYDVFQQLFTLDTIINYPY